VGGGGGGGSLGRLRKTVLRGGGPDPKAYSSESLGRRRRALDRSVARNSLVQLEKMVPLPSERCLSL